ncbi:MAG: hypothetical protein D8M58_05535 [Calditrichaeota bacterium]|nr:MAG: hypothetical protein DWQ03_20970 [Calditrichota bacterium]MBL1204838.1 hypothetical protein [Calditrichota bacterium]NOG44667.1 hypothetical protein [Calditrichota bacterium]
MINISNKKVFIYYLDSNDKIIDVDDNWLSFAAENVYSISQSFIKDKPIWDIITDIEIQHFYKILIDKVRTYKTKIHFPFRCDSPDCRRFMELSLRLDQENRIEFKSRLIREEFREPVDLFDVQNDRSKELVRVCSWCKKVAVSDNTWLEVEDAIRELSLFDYIKLPKITHSICPTCHKNNRRLLESFRSN